MRQILTMRLCNYTSNRKKKGNTFTSNKEDHHILIIDSLTERSNCIQLMI